MAQSKFESYIGFCFRAGKITLGANAINGLKRGVYLLILDGKSAKNSIRYAIKYKNKFDCPLIVYNGDFEKIVKKPLCRLAAIRDKSLAEAILKSGDVSVEEYTGGDN